MWLSVLKTNDSCCTLIVTSTSLPTQQDTVGAINILRLFSFLLERPSLHENRLKYVLQSGWLASDETLPVGCLCQCYSLPPIDNIQSRSWTKIMYDKCVFMSCQSILWTTITISCCSFILYPCKSYWVNLNRMLP